MQAFFVDVELNVTKKFVAFVLCFREFAFEGSAASFSYEFDEDEILAVIPVSQMTPSFKLPHEVP